MIAFFPEPYPDELAYSLFARYHVQSGHLSFSATARELFGKENAIPNPEFFAPLSEELYKILTYDRPFEKFIADHTMLPYYIRFLPLERRRKAMELLLTMDRRFYDAIYIRKKKTKQRQYMCYCPICAAADRQQHGETYWHRKHQVPGIEICLIHRCRLKNSSVGIKVEDQRFSLIHAEAVIPMTEITIQDNNRNIKESQSIKYAELYYKEEDKQLLIDDISALEYQVSEYVMQVFDADMDFKNDVSSGKFLQSRLEGTSYTSLRGEQVFARKLFDAITEYYKDFPQNSLEAWWYVQKIFCSQNFHTYDICLVAFFLHIPICDLLHMKLPEMTLQQRFDNQVRLLRSQGMTQKQTAETMGVSIHAIKGVEEKRYRSARL